MQSQVGVRGIKNIRKGNTGKEGMSFRYKTSCKGNRFLDTNK